MLTTTCSIEKAEQDGRTFTTIKPLEGRGRVEEIARMISGENLTETAHPECPRDAGTGK